MLHSTGTFVQHQAPEKVGSTLIFCMLLLVLMLVNVTSPMMIYLIDKWNRWKRPAAELHKI